MEAAWADIGLDAAALRALLLAEGTPESTICEADAIAMAEEVSQPSHSCVSGIPMLPTIRTYDISK